MSDVASAPGRRTLVGIGAALLGLAVVLWLDANQLPQQQTVGVGPTAGMRLVSVLLAILSLAHWVAAWRLPRQRVPVHVLTPEDPANRAALVWVLAGLLGLIAILQLGGGFVISAAWLFVATARAFGQPLGFKSPAIGLTLAFLVYAFFTKALSLSLPAGPLERLLLG
jgi:putative tricarboxylic transport membrane protein